MFFSWTPGEDDALQYLPLLDQVIYLRGIRRFMNRETGIAGLARGISWKSLSEIAEVHRQRGSTDPESTPTRQAIRSALVRLERAGLITKLPASARFEGLVFRCDRYLQDSYVSGRNNHENNHGEGPRSDTPEIEQSRGFEGMPKPDAQPREISEEQPASTIHNITPKTPSTTARAQSSLGTISPDPAWEAYRSALVDWFGNARGVGGMAIANAQNQTAYRRWFDAGLTLDAVKAHIAQIDAGYPPTTPKPPRAYCQHVLDLARSTHKPASHHQGGTSHASRRQSRPSAADRVRESGERLLGETGSGNVIDLDETRYRSQ